MANAQERMVQKTRTVQESYTERDGITLELTDSEASFIAAVLGSKVVGDGPWRDVSSGIFDALSRHGYSRVTNELTNTIRLYHMEGIVTLNG